MPDYICKDCGVHFNQDVAPAGQCPVCYNRRVIDRIKNWIQDSGD